MAIPGLLHPFVRLLLVLVLAAPAAGWAQSNRSSPVPVTKAEPRAAFRAEGVEIPASVVTLPPMDPAEIDAVRLRNSQSTTKRLQVGIVREARDMREARVEALAWRLVDGVYVARWEVSSPGANELRVEVETAGLPEGVELRFAGSADPGLVYGPVTSTSSPEGTHWGPVLEGDVAIVEVSVPKGLAYLPASFAVTRVAHQFVSMRDAAVEVRAKASLSCNVDLICEAPTDTALANVAKGVARMSFIDGGSFLCTGTLIQATNLSNTPYFYTAAHCIDNQAAATSLTTLWFYERTTCSPTSPVNPGVQRTGGATLLYANASSDVAFLQLLDTPPAGAWFAGWDATPVGNTTVLGVHHPDGDPKKLSRGNAAGFQAVQTPNQFYPSLLRSNWTLGVTEGGSSGSGIFTPVGPSNSPTDYRLRGGLCCGPQATCGASNYDFYSRLDEAYPFIRQWIDPPPPPLPTLNVVRMGAGTGSVSSTPAGISCPTSCSASFAANSSVTLTATPTGGSVFGGWSGHCSGLGACIVTMDGAKQVIATFLPPGTGATLTVSRAGAGTGAVFSSGAINCPATCTADFDGGTVVSLYPAASAGSTFAGWSGDCSGVAPCTVTMDRARSVTASFATGGTARMINVSTGAIAFGGQSMGTTSPPSPVVIMNTGSDTVAFGAIGASAQFGQSGNCSNIAPGYSCTVNATFTPAVTGIGLGQSAAVTGQLTIPSNAAGSPHAVALSGSAEKSLVTHYYRSILRRAPDAGGKAFWEGEAQRLVGLGVNVNEAWFAMAQAFYGSPEYAALNRGTAAFVTDLYNTFFNRIPDSGGLGYWNQELVNGLPRGVVLAAFMFSPEFRAFSQAIFGNAPVRPEVDAVVDFYRGILGRLPDNGGFAYWLQRFRAAQCVSQSQVVAEVEAISGAFTGSPEYGARMRDNPQFVGDLYNGFLRRGGDLGGVQFWISQVATGAMSRDQVRVQFKNSAEFQARVNAILAATCIP